MILLLPIALQAVSDLPDIQFSASVRARSVTIEKRGDAKLLVTTSPEGRNVVDVQAPKANGRKTIRNVRATVNAEARIGMGAGPAGSSETTPQQ